MFVLLSFVATLLVTSSQKLTRFRQGSEMRLSQNCMTFPTEIVGIPSLLLFFLVLAQYFSIFSRKFYPPIFLLTYSPRCCAELPKITPKSENQF